MVAPRDADIITCSIRFASRNSRSSDSSSGITNNTDCPRYRTPGRSMNPAYRYSLPFFSSTYPKMNRCKRPHTDLSRLSTSQVTMNPGRWVGFCLRALRTDADRGAQYDQLLITGGVKKLKPGGDCESENPIADPGPLSATRPSSLWARTLGWVLESLETRSLRRRRHGRDPCERVCGVRKEGTR